jgi:hypothetical protein
MTTASKRSVMFPPAKSITARSPSAATGASAKSAAPRCRRRAVEQRERLLAQPLQARKVVVAGRAQQPAVEKGLRGREHGMAVHVVLLMLVRLIADAHRADAAIARQRIDAALAEVAIEADAIHGLRREVGDAHSVALRVNQFRLHDRRVGNVGLPRLGDIDQLDRERATPGSIVAAASEQGVKHRVGVRTRQAAPDDAPASVDQRVERAVADDGEREIGLSRSRHASAPRLDSGAGAVARASMGTSSRTKRATSFCPRK